ncbi:LacI family DNA-binding transcriptional regulator [Microlunatus soli]|uniref:DNA-binding transcriptional regulator, LacI/PurR family n=1 Tax=Microlunatus soli TaxID=630515 RepID=A0A1H1TWQ3_9ACTN|nr:LacI family DNA-binding transcriptional regulator [Microlunatus soli]SDS64366.1 DNA-binding transcriptional regulator, LacI/PurR family [Microlunatus soli]
MGVTIYQVARAAGVSPSTVSNVLNGRDGRMLPETRSRVVRAMQDLGYRPNHAARQLRTGRASAIGLVVPSVANPFWGAFAQRVEAAALTHGQHVLLCNSERDPDRERAYVDELWAEGLRAIVLCTSLPSLDHLADKISAGLRLVAFDRTAQLGDPDQVINISIDNVLGTKMATQHLLDLGHRRIAFISGSLGSINRKERHRGFVEAAAAAKLGDGAITWAADDDDFADLDAAALGRAAVAELLQRPEELRPTAVLTINDMTALGVCAGARTAGLTPGRDLSVIGFDDILLAELAWPPLTTIRQPLDAMATAAVDYLRADPDGAVTAPSVLIRPELVTRDSTGPATA